MPTKSQLRDLELYVRICRYLDDGWLPLFLPETIMAGSGSGSRCHACDQPITFSQIEYEVTDPRGSARLDLHLGCYVIWQIECVRLLREQRQVSFYDQHAPAINESDDIEPVGNGALLQ